MSGPFVPQADGRGFGPHLPSGAAGAVPRLRPARMGAAMACAWNARRMNLGELA